MNGASTTADDDRAARALGLFAPCWAIALLFHQSEFIHWARDPIELASTVAAVVTIVRPRSLGAFLCLMVLEVATIWVQLPLVSNHFLYSGMVCATILVAAIREVFTPGGWPLSPGRLYRAFAPLVRIELMVLYFFVVFHKLNADFFSPDVSCAGDHYRHLVRILPFMPSATWIAEANIWMTIVVETAIPLLLIVRRTRTLGILVAAFFHYFVGINYYFDFSSMLYASYLLFAPDDLPDRIAARWRDARVRRWLEHPVGGFVRRALPGWFLALVVFLTWAIVTHNSFGDALDRFGKVWRVYGVVWMIGYGGAIGWRGNVQLPAWRLFRPLRPSLLVLPLVLFLNGASPYLGLKTDSSFAMFSNLRTELGRSNHFIIPAGALEIWDYQRDVVRIIRSSYEPLDRLARLHQPVPYFRFRSIISDAVWRHQRDIQVVYTYEGKRIALDRAEEDHALRRRYPLWARKFFLFREIQVGARERCDH